MEFLPYYLLIGVAVGFLVVLLVKDLRPILRVLLILGQVTIIALLILLLGWVVGWWGLPRPMVNTLVALDRLWKPFHEAFMEWIRGYFR